jgi:hypothetical protein
MDKVKLTYSIEGTTYKLLDPEHFYGFLAGKNVSATLDAELKEYLHQHPRKLAPFSDH